MEPAQTPGPTPLAGLRQWARPRPPAERCDLCGVGLAPQHPHLLRLSDRQIDCACVACAILFDNPQNGKYRRIPDRVRYLADFQMTDSQWDSLFIPIQMAFFFYSSPEKLTALYPSPAGATESLLTLDAWKEIVAINPVLGDMEPQVEALLVNRVGSSRDYYLVGVDQCFRLVGLIRSGWRGLAGGIEVWKEITRFFEDLKKLSGREGGSHA